MRRPPPTSWRSRKLPRWAQVIAQALIFGLVFGVWSAVKGRPAQWSIIFGVVSGVGMAGANYVVISIKRHNWRNPT